MRALARIAVFSAVAALAILAAPSSALADDEPGEEAAQPAAAETPSHAQFGIEDTDEGGDSAPSAAPEESPVPGESPAADLELDARGGQGLVLVQAHLDEVQFEAKPANIDYRSNLVSSYQHILDMFCFAGSMRALTYEGPPDEKHCRTFIDKLLAVDSQNPAAICARDGIGAAACAKAYDGQKFEVVTDHPAPVPSNSQLSAAEQSKFRAALEPPKSPRLLKLVDSLKPLLNKRIKPVVGKKMDPAVRADFAQTELQLRSIYSQLLDIRCAMYRMRLTPAVGQAGKPAPPPGLSALLGKGYGTDSGDSDKKKDDAPSFGHVRQLATSCMMQIGEARKVFPDLAAATCYEIGLYSPKCFAALHEARLRAVKLKVIADSAKVPGAGGAAAPNQQNRAPSEPRKVLDTF
jgi:hypothetical protein